MTPRDARVVAICRATSLAVAIAATIAVLPARDHWLWIVFVVFVYGSFSSRTIPAGFFPVSLPSFDEQVAGLMLCGKGEEAAVREASRSEASRAIFMTATSTLLLVLLDLAAYNINFISAAAPRALNAIVGQAALWLVGIGVFLFILPFVILALHLHRRS